MSDTKINLVTSTLEELSENDILFKTLLYPKVEESIKNPANEKKLIQHIGKYRDRNIEILSSPIILNNMFFNNRDKDIIFEVTNIEREYVEKLLETVKPPDGSTKGLPENVTAFNVIMLMLIRYYIIAKKPKQLEIINAYYAYSMYFTIYHKYFPFPPNEAIMKATINSLSYKYDIKSLGSVDKMIRQTNNITIESYEQRIIRGNDSDIIYVIMQIKSRANGKMKKIKNMYKISEEKGDVLFTENTFNKEGVMNESGGMLSNVQVSTTTAVTKFFAMPDVDMKILSFCCKVNEVSAKDLRSTIQMINDKKFMPEVEAFYQALFYLFYTNGGKREDIGGKRFYVICNEIYKKGNSNDKNINKIKQLLHNWLNASNNTYRVTERNATLNSIRKALYFYFVLVLMKK